MLEKTRSRGKRHKVFRSKRWLDLVRSLGCVICQQPAHAHHIRDEYGTGQKAPDDESIPLCHYHHQGAEGIHTLGTKVWQAKYGSERYWLRYVLFTLKELGHVRSNT